MGNLGWPEIMIILVIALIVFGPRKLPELGKTLGQSLAQFRKASEDFKRTWDKEATLEETGDTNSRLNQFALAEQNSILETEAASAAEAPAVTTSEEAIARDTSGANELQPGVVSDAGNLENVADETRPAPKNEWL